MKVRTKRLNEYDNFTELEYENSYGVIVYITFNDYYFDGSLDSILELMTITNIPIIDDVDNLLEDEGTYLFDVTDEYISVLVEYFKSINKEFEV